MEDGSDQQSVAGFLPMVPPLQRSLRVDQHIGDVEKVISDSDSGQMTHFVVSQGVLLKEHKLIPEHWVSSLGEDEVHLAVRARVVENLPDYESVAA